MIWEHQIIGKDLSTAQPQGQVINDEHDEVLHEIDDPYQDDMNILHSEWQQVFGDPESDNE